MKKRVLSLLLALVLAVSIFVMPAEAASAKEVHTYLTELAKAGQYDSDAGWWSDGFNIGENAYFGVFYLESSGYIELSTFDENYEVTWRISSNPSPAYNAYIMSYQGNEAKGTVQIQAGYNGSSFSSFKSYTGDSSRTAELLDVLNERLPLVMEITRLVIGTKNYTLADLGITGYKQCLYVHAFDSGKITKQPTCAQSGEKTYTCTVCGYTRTERVDPTGQHKWDADTVVSAGVPGRCPSVVPCPTTWLPSSASRCGTDEATRPSRWVCVVPMASHGLRCPRRSTAPDIR